MAQDLFLIPLECSPDTYPRTLVTDILSRGASHPVTDYECVYPDGSRGEASVISHEPQELLPPPGFTHFGGRTMMERIYELADTLEVFVCWSCRGDGEPNACVTRAERALRVPEDAQKVLTVAVVRDVDHFNQLVKGCSFEKPGE